ncbi:hypothetical protein SAMN05216588_12452 [Pseudomonas flavescens]|uniref:Uncharacterized protein n=1 Tax=Phytopseudomonas flavescens TaxID=29435 RepID=A0A1G8NAU0_9GAMM|nr:hypothetical protein SAMN05216588_12452 [Pseudomonas flavescens]
MSVTAPSYPRSPAKLIFAPGQAGSKAGARYGPAKPIGSLCTRNALFSVHGSEPECVKPLLMAIERTHTSATAKRGRSMRDRHEPQPAFRRARQTAWPHAALDAQSNA